MWHFLSTASVVPPDGQGLKQLGELALAFVLSSLIGIEREWRQKSAGLRTHTLVGTGAALFLIVSKYGFTDVLGPHVILDPSRVAAQIASGIGLIGGGLIFVRGDGVRGLTTAAIVWITAAIGMARGAGLAILALAATVAHFIVVFAYPSARGRAFPIPIRRIRSPRHIRGRPGDLREILSHSTRLGFSIARVQTQQLDHEVRGLPAVAVTLQLQGQPTVEQLTLDINDLDAVLEVTSSDLGTSTD